MGKEVRYVAKDWQHPQENGYAIPLSKSEMPLIKDGKATYVQMYEIQNNKGVPISPAMKEPKDLAKWLTKNKTPALGNQATSYEAWLVVCQGKSVIHHQVSQQPDPFTRIDQQTQQRKRGLERE